MRTAPAALLLALALTACTSDDPATPGEPAGEEAVGTVTFAGLDSVAWEQTEVGATAGPNDLTLSCGPSVPHGLAIEGVQGGEEILACTGGQAITATLDLSPGDYTFFCTVPGHRDAGMTGTLTVN